MPYFFRKAKLTKIVPNLSNEVLKAKNFGGEEF
jgi:hypothetical protein